MSERKPPTMEFSHHPSASPFNVSQQEYLKAHPSRQFGYLATGALVLDKSDADTPRILLIQRAATDSMPNKWETPGGGCDDEDQSILYAVARELWEEAGLEASYISGPVGEPYLFSSRSGKLICKFNFMVDVKSTSEVTLDPEEHQRFLWATEAQVKARMVDGLGLEFTKEEQLATILRAFEQLRSEG